MGPERVCCHGDENSICRALGETFQVCIILNLVRSQRRPQGPFLQAAHGDVIAARDALIVFLTPERQKFLHGMLALAHTVRTEPRAAAELATPILLASWHRMCTNSHTCIQILRTDMHANRTFGTHIHCGTKGGGKVRRLHTGPLLHRRFPQQHRRPAVVGHHTPAAA